MPGSRLASRGSSGRSLCTHGNVVFTARCATDAGSLPGRRAVSLSSATGLPLPGDQVPGTTSRVSRAPQHPPLPHQRSLPSTKHRLQHLTTPPAAFHTPSTVWTYQQTQEQGTGTTGTWLTDPGATSLRVLFRDVTTVPVTLATYAGRQKAARFPPGLPTGAGSTEVWYRIPAPQERAGRRLTCRCHQGRRVRAAARCQPPAWLLTQEEGHGNSQ